MLAACTDREECLVLEFLENLGANDEKDVARMLNLLRERVPEAGPPTHNQELSKPLEDGIFEFRRGALRVLYFYDRGSLVICTHGFYKQGQKTPRREIERAKDIRASYTVAAQGGTLSILDLSDGEA